MAQARYHEHAIFFYCVFLSTLNKNCFLEALCTRTVQYSTVQCGSGQTVQTRTKVGQGRDSSRGEGGGGRLPGQ